MPSIPQIFRRRGRSKTQPEIPPNLPSPQASPSTVRSNNISSGWNNRVSLGSQGIPAEREPFQRVPEDAEDYRIPAELDTSGNPSWVSVPLAPQQPRYYQQHAQQPRYYQQHAQQPRYYQQHAQQPQLQQRHNVIGAEEAMSRARQANDIVAQRNEEEHILERTRNASAANVRRLRELIRERYALDLELWGKRNVAKAVRKKIEPKCKKADAILQEIYFIVNAWEEDLFDKDEWDTVRRIKARLSMRPHENGQSGDPAIWGDLAPWDRRERVDYRSLAVESH